MSNWTEEDLNEAYDRLTKEGAITISQPGNIHSYIHPPPDVGSAKKVSIPRRGRMNKWESEYAQILEGQKLKGIIKWYGFEALRFRLATGAFFTPDFIVQNADGTMAAHEVKGFPREAAILRYKVAAEQFPCIQFLMFRKRKVKEGGGWTRIR